MTENLFLNFQSFITVNFIFSVTEILIKLYYAKINLKILCDLYTLETLKHGFFFFKESFMGH